jgi:hypothetical protein
MWKHTPLQVHLFSPIELPTKEPAPLPNYSIGEEISGSPPISIAWSPPGLAKHRRCALGALTANLVLSIWSSDGEPQDGSSWDRRLLINNALFDYFLNTTDGPSHVDPDPSEQMRLRTRVRAFAWAPAFPSSSSTKVVGTRLPYGQHIVAVCNDDNHIAFVVVDSPTSTLEVERRWYAEVLTHVSLTPDSGSIFSRPASFDDIMKQQRHISHIAWSPWILQGDWYHAVIVYATNEDVRARTVTFANDGIGFSEEVVYPDIEMRYNGTVKWSPVVENGTILTLALFTITGLIYLKVSAVDAIILTRITHDLDGRWDRNSGVIWDTVHSSAPRLHFSSLLSTTQSPTAVLEASPTGFKALDSPSWRDHIERSAVLFSVKNDLKGNSKVKVWGLAASPLCDFVATCHSVHPSDMIEYGSQHDRSGTVTIDALHQYRHIRKHFPRLDVSAEGILFTIKKLAQNTVESTDQMLAFTEEMVEKLIQAYSPASLEGNAGDVSRDVVNPDDLNALIKDFKSTSFLDPHTLRDRYTILVSHACHTTISNDLPRTLIAYRLAIAANKSLDALFPTLFSAEIVDHHRRVIALIQTLIDPKNDDASFSRNQSDSTAVARPREATRDSDPQSLDSTASISDTCDFCSAPIPFTDLTSATCTNGHNFPRCGLSFLAIQAPGISKYCGICHTPFLSDEFVSSQEISVQQENAGATNGEDEQTNGTTQAPNREGQQIEKSADEEFMAMERLEGPENFPEEEHDIPEGLQNAAEEGRRELPITLARVLFLACDACIYCGGKFVG